MLARGVKSLRGLLVLESMKMKKDREHERTSLYLIEWWTFTLYSGEYRAS